MHYFNLILLPVLFLALYPLVSYSYQRNLNFTKTYLPRFLFEIKVLTNSLSWRAALVSLLRKPSRNRRENSTPNGVVTWPFRNLERDRDENRSRDREHIVLIKYDKLNNSGARRTFWGYTSDITRVGVKHHTRTFLRLLSLLLHLRLFSYILFRWKCWNARSGCLMAGACNKIIWAVKKIQRFIRVGPFYVQWDL